MDNNKLIEKTRKQLSKLGYSEEKIEEFLKSLETEEEETEKVEEEPKVENPKVEEPKVEEKVLEEEQEQVVDAKPVIDYETKYNELKSYIDNALNGINQKFEGLNAKTEKSYEMLSAMGVDKEPEENEIQEDKIAKMFGGLASEDFVETQPEGDSIENLFEGK